MRLVTQTLFMDKRYGITKALDIIKSAGFDAYDYTMNIHADGAEEFLSDSYWDKIKEIKAHADAIGIPCAQAHAPYDDCQTDMLPAIIRSMEYAAYLGSEVIVVHGETDNFGYYEHREELFDKNVALYRKLIPHAEKLSIRVAVENLYGWDSSCGHNIESICSHHEEFIRYIDAIGSDYAVACVDTGHCQLVHEAPETMIAMLGSRIGALHIHDNNGLEDGHSIPYSGKINWDNVCSALKEVGYNGNFTFEADRFFEKMTDDKQIEDAIRYLAQTGRNLISKITG